MKILHHIIISLLLFKLCKNCSNLEDNISNDAYVRQMALSIGLKNIMIIGEADTDSSEKKIVNKNLIESVDESWQFGLRIPEDKVLIDPKEIAHLGVHFESEKLMIYGSKIKNNIFSNCVHIENLTKRFYFFIYELLQYQYENVDLADSTQNVDSPFNRYKGYKVIDENFKSIYNDFRVMKKFIIYIDTEKSPNISGHIPPEKVNNIIRTITTQPELEDIYHIQDKDLKSRMMKQVGRILSFLGTELNIRMHFFFDEYTFPAFYKQLVLNHVFETKFEKNVYNYFKGFEPVPEKCEDQGIFKKELCQTVLSNRCDGKRLNFASVGFLLIIMEYLDKLFQKPEELQIPENVSQLRKKLTLTSFYSLKKLYYTFDEYTKTGFDCFIQNMEVFDKEYVFVSTKEIDSKNKHFTAEKFIDSIINKIDDDDLISPLLSLQNPSVKLEKDCNECFLIKVTREDNLSYSFENKKVEKSPIIMYNLIDYIDKQNLWFFNMREEDPIEDEKIQIIPNFNPEDETHKKIIAKIQDSNLSQKNVNI